MVRAGALYFAIVIAFVIAIISASLIMLASHYRNSYLKEIRYARLLTNLSSGIVYALADVREIENQGKIDLYGKGTDTISISKKDWGIFELVTLRVNILQDTLKKAFLVGYPTDSTALYLSDEDRPLSVSGTTKITGNALVPKSGIRKAYAEGKPYANEKLVYNGEARYSNRKLPSLNQRMLTRISVNLNRNANNFPVLKQQELIVSFLDSVQQFKLSAFAILEAVKLKGNIILFADSAVHILANAQLDGIQIYAPYIKIDSGFNGNCQLFARDSIVAGNSVHFNYPSVLGVIRTLKSGSQPQLKIGAKSTVKGILFSYEEKRSPLQTLICLGKNAAIIGEIFSVGMLKLEKGVVINGKASCNRFVMQTPVTLYENFLIDISFNRLGRSKYYLSSKLFDYPTERKVLKWLN